MCFAAVCRYVGLGTLSKKIGCAIYLQAVVFQESECGEYSHLPELEQGCLHKGQFMQVPPLLRHLPWQPPSLPVPRGSSFVSLQEERQFQQLTDPCIACCIVQLVCKNCSCSYIVCLPACMSTLHACLAEYIAFMYMYVCWLYAIVLLNLLMISCL